MSTDQTRYQPNTRLTWESRRCQIGINDLIVVDPDLTHSSIASARLLLLFRNRGWSGADEGKEHAGFPFLTHLATEGNVATATQNQAMNALVFLYKRVLTPTRRRHLHHSGPAGHNDLATTMIYTHILQQGGHGVPSPLDDLGV